MISINNFNNIIFLFPVTDNHSSNQEAAENELDVVINKFVIGKVPFSYQKAKTTKILGARFSGQKEHMVEGKTVYILQKDLDKLEIRLKHSLHELEQLIDEGRTCKDDAGSLDAYLIKFSQNLHQIDPEKYVELPPNFARLMANFEEEAHRHAVQITLEGIRLRLLNFQGSKSASSSLEEGRNPVLARINALIENMEEIQKFLAPVSWEDLPDDGKAFKLLFELKIWADNLKSVGVQPSTRDSNHAVYGPEETRLEKDFPGNEIKLSGGTAHAVSAPYDEREVAELLKLVGEAGGYLTRLSLSKEAPGIRKGYLEYVPEKLGVPVLYGDVTVTLQEREILPIESGDPTQYVILDKISVKKKKKTWEIPVYTYHNFVDRGEPDFLCFSNFIKRTMKQKGAEFVHCKAGVGRTGMYLLCKYSDREGNKPRILEDFHLMRNARSNEMVQGDNQLAFVFGFVKAKVNREYRISPDNIAIRNATQRSGQRSLDYVQSAFTDLVSERLNRGKLKWKDIQGQIFRGVDERVLKSFLYSTTDHVISNSACLIEMQIPYVQFAKQVVDHQKWCQVEFGLGGLSAENLFRDHSQVVVELLKRLEDTAEKS